MQAHAADLCAEFAGTHSGTAQCCLPNVADFVYARDLHAIEDVHSTHDGPILEHLRKFTTFLARQIDSFC